MDLVLAFFFWLLVLLGTDRIIVPNRHGNRLDVADKQWHLTSPTPYDPPLAYGGWLQAKALGAKIGAIIRERIQEDEEAARIAAQNDSPGRRKRRKYKVVLHSSPFLRCIQTSIAVSAGLAQDSTPFEASMDGGQFPSSHESLDGSRATTMTHFSGACGTQHPLRKTPLRLDAFLGEWLNPGYYELIAHPPESVMMLAGAKADLLRREDYSQYPGFNLPTSPNASGQLWSTGGTPGTPSGNSTPRSNGLDGLPALATSLPIGGQASNSSSTAAPRDASPVGYVSPMPNYAISSGATIPLGFVAHARDKCVDIDYQWDSMREPLDWGTGGTFPEEWAIMHKRFRNGLQALIDWYSTEEDPTGMVTKTFMRMVPTAPTEADGPADDEEEVETESIVILVSHGAGCNAMIGAITHQPALTEVSTASLTMAVRKPGKESPDALADDGMDHMPWDKSQGLIPIHRFYDMRLTGSTEHLRSSTSTPNTARPSALASALSGTRGRHANSLSSALSNVSYFEFSENRSSSANASMGGIRRDSSSLSSRPSLGLGSNIGGITVGSGRSAFSSSISKPLTLTRPASMGLWSPITPPGEGEDDEDDNMLPNFGDSNTVSKSTQALANPTPTPSSPADSKHEADLSASIPTASLKPLPSPKGSIEGEKMATIPQLGLGLGGLWGASPISSPMEDAINA